ncbi:DUF6440 family protein [Fusicatenibacter sp.]
MWVDKETGVNYLFHASGYADGFKPGVSSHKRQKAPGYGFFSISRRTSSAVSRT